jgi:hypothetical protein
MLSGSLALSTKSADRGRPCGTRGAIVGRKSGLRESDGPSMEANGFHGSGGALDEQVKSVFRKFWPERQEKARD